MKHNNNFFCGLRLMALMVMGLTLLTITAHTLSYKYLWTVTHNYYYDATLTQNVWNEFRNDYYTTGQTDNHIYYTDRLGILRRWPSDEEKEHDTSYHYEEESEEPMDPPPSNRTYEYYRNFVSFNGVDFTVDPDVCSKYLPTNIECQDNTTMVNVTFPDVTVSVTGNEVILNNLTFKEGGNISISGTSITGTEFKGSLIFGGTLQTGGNTVNASELSLKLNLTGRDGTETDAMIDNLANLEGLTQATVMVSKRANTVTHGIVQRKYILADGASTFNGSISVECEGVSLGTVAVDETLYSTASNFSLTNENGKLVLVERENGTTFIDSTRPKGQQDCSINAKPLDGTETTLGVEGTASDWTDAWYVCETPATENGGKGLTYSPTLTLANYCHVHLILADGCKMTVEGSGSGTTINGSTNSSLEIFAQSTGAAMGILDVSNGKTGINCGDITINGGKVNATANKGWGINGNNTVTIIGGSVTAKSEGGGFGIYAGGDITITGGQVDAEGSMDGIYSNGSNVTIGKTNASDYIYASSIGTSGSVTIPKGNYFATDDDVYGSEDADYILDASDIEGKTLKPAVKVAGSGQYMDYVGDGDYNIRGSNTQALYPIGLEFTSTANGYSAHVLLGTLDGIAQDKAVILADGSGGNLDANIWLVGNSSDEILTDYNSRTDRLQNFVATDGVKDMKQLIAEASDPNYSDDSYDATTSTVDPSEYYIFIISGNSFRPVSVTATTVPKAGNCLLIIPKWNILMHKDLGTGANNGSSGSAARSIGLGNGGGTTEVSEKLRVNSEEFATAQWYTLDGRKLNQAPKAKGVYIHGSKKVVR